MKSRLHISALAALAGLAVLFSCTDINHLHEPYLERGEQIYLGKPDSVHLFSGKNRVLADVWFSDVKAKNLVVKYNGDTDSVCIPLVREPERPLRSDPVSIEIPDVNEGIATTFKFIIYDANMKYKSLTMEALGSAYGNDYQESIQNRILTNATYEDGQLKLAWLSTGSTQIQYTEIEYVAENGEKAVYKLKPAETACTLGVQAGSKVRYRSMFLPEETTVDPFYTEYKEFVAGE